MARKWKVDVILFPDVEEAAVLTSKSATMFYDEKGSDFMAERSN